MAPFFQPMSSLDLCQSPFLNCPQCRKSCQGLVRPPLKIFQGQEPGTESRTGPPAHSHRPPESLISQADAWADPAAQ